MSLLAAQTALLAEVRAALPATVRSVEPGPGAWDKAYFARILGLAPAVRLAFLSGANGAPNADMLSLDTRWAVIVVTTWEGRSRQAGADAALVLTQTLCAALHWCQPDGIGIVSVLDVERIWTGEIDAQARSVAAIVIEVEVPIDPEDTSAVLDDFLRAGDAWRPDVLTGVYVRAAGLAGLQPGQFALTPDLQNPDDTARLVWSPVEADEAALAEHWHAGREMTLFEATGPWTVAGTLRLEAIRDPVEGFRFIADVKLREGAVPATDVRAAFGPALSGDPFSIPHGD